MMSPFDQDLNEEFPEVMDGIWLDMGEDIEDVQSLPDDVGGYYDFDTPVEDVSLKSNGYLLKRGSPKDWSNYESDTDTVLDANPDFSFLSPFDKSNTINCPPLMQRCHTLSSNWDSTQLPCAEENDTRMEDVKLEPRKQHSLETPVAKVEPVVKVETTAAETETAVESHSADDEISGKPRFIVKFQPLDIFYKDEGGRGNQLRCTVALGGEVSDELFEYHKTEENLASNSIPLHCTVVLEDGTELSKSESDQVLSFESPPRLDLKTRVADIRFRFERTSVNFRKLRMRLRVDVLHCDVASAVSDPVKVLSKRKRLKSVVRNRLTKEREAQHELNQRKRLKLSCTA